jgi:hypothetical protein
VRSRPGAARTILLFHIISASPSKQPRMVGSTLAVYSFGLIFVSARTNKRHHHHNFLVVCLHSMLELLEELMVLHPSSGNPTLHTMFSPLYCLYIHTDRKRPCHA